MKSPTLFAAAALAGLALAGFSHATTYFRIDEQPAAGLPLFQARAYDIASEFGQVIQPADMLVSAGGPAWFLPRNAKVRPIVGGTLTNVTYQAQGSERFDAFSFKVRSLQPDQVVYVTVKPVGQKQETFSFDIANNFGPSTRLGIIGNSGEAIKWVRVSSADGFAKVKGAQFSAGAVPEPAAWTLMAAGVALAGAALRTRRRAAATA